jgi:colicin import membrane protein
MPRTTPKPPPPPEPKTDSIKGKEAALASMQEHAAGEKIKLVAAEEAHKKAEAEKMVQLRKEEDEYLQTQLARTQNADTREALLERIRAMREEKPPEIKPVGRTEEMMAQFEAEQAAGRAAVARHEENNRRNAELRARIEAEERARQMQNQPVHHPNPTQHEEFPTQTPSNPDPLLHQRR